MKCSGSYNVKQLIKLVGHAYHNSLNREQMIAEYPQFYQSCENEAVHFVKMFRLRIDRELYSYKPKCSEHYEEMLGHFHSMTPDTRKKHGIRFDVLTEDEYLCGEILES